MFIKQGECQWILCNFKTTFQLTKLDIQFQGGFASKQILIEFFDDNNICVHQTTVYPEDNNLLQKFVDIHSNGLFSRRIKLTLSHCTDMFGRVIVYGLQLSGSFQ